MLHSLGFLLRLDGPGLIIQLRFDIFCNFLSVVFGAEKINKKMWKRMFSPNIHHFTAINSRKSVSWFEINLCYFMFYGIITWSILLQFFFSFTGLIVVNFLNRVITLWH